MPGGTWRLLVSLITLLTTRVTCTMPVLGNLSQVISPFVSTYQVLEACKYQPSTNLMPIIPTLQVPIKGSPVLSQVFCSTYKVP